jgi:cell division transport system permease protein
MSVAGKSSLKRSKPNYIYSIIGVSLVLLIMGIMGLLFLNFREVSTTFKEDIRLSAYLRTMNKDTISMIQQYLSKQPYAKDVVYVNKESAKQIWNKENNEDWAKILDVNPLPESIDFYAKAAYINKDSLKIIQSRLMAIYGNQITDLQYPQSLVSNLNERTEKIGLIFLVIAVVLIIIVIFSIDNTIRLAMFSNRFLIKTMQMVGATRGFIAKPMNVRALVNGLISSGIAIFILFSLIQWADSQFPQLRTLHNTESTIGLFIGIIIVGVGISIYSTYRSVIKYLKMSLDDLY